MNQRILLADNSYTIRRIVELSFQDIDNVELFSFESGANLKEKLLEIIPQIILIDIKLPEFNGYEVCKFVNEEPSLKDTKVLLMKGGFEPIDEQLLKDLNYEDIITKPFDSKLLESQVIKLLGETESTVTTPPLSIPEELNVPSFSENAENENISIENESEPESFPDSLPDFTETEKDDSVNQEEGISFSDIDVENEKNEVSIDIGETESDDKESLPIEDAQNDMNFKEELNEIETPEILSEDEMLDGQSGIIDEVEPSEEITQGAYDDQEDALLSEPEDEISNPFKDDSEIKIEETSSATDEHNLKEQIKIHEDEMGMDSLTVEEMRIKSEIENRNKGIDDEENEYGTDSFGGLDKKPDFSNISFSEEDKIDSTEPVVEEAQPDVKEPEEKIDPSIFEAADGILNDDIDILNEADKPIDEPISDMDISITDSAPEGGNLNEFFENAEKDMIPNETPDELEIGVPEPVESEPVIDQELQEQEISAPETSSFIDTGDDVDSKIEMPEFGNVEEEISTYTVTDEPEIKQEILTEESSVDVESEVAANELIVEPVVEPVVETIEKIEEPKIDTIPVSDAPEKIIADAPEIESVEMDKIIERVEDKLTVSIKEILWDVIPSIAEKIIKEEITTLKTDIDKKDI